MGAYVAVQIAYSSGLKNEPILDLACVSAGFILRAVAGGVATSVPLSNWFLIVVSFGSLLVVTGKRSGEKQLLAEGDTDDRAVRQTLGLYTPSFLRSVRTLSAAVTVSAYCLWAFERANAVHPGHDPVWPFQLTIIPFVIALLHVLRLLDIWRWGRTRGGAGVLRDHRLQIYGAGLGGLVRHRGVTPDVESASGRGPNSSDSPSTWELLTAWSAPSAPPRQTSSTPSIPTWSTA